MVPSRGAKKAPCVSWKIYQSQLPTASQLKAWDDDFRPERWGPITGELSGIIVIDFDGEEGSRWLEKWGLDPHIRTGSGGHHVYFFHPGWYVPTMNAKSGKNTWPFPGVDVRGDGGFAVLLGKNSSGTYDRLRDLDPYPFDILPAELSDFLRRNSKSFHPELPEQPDEDATPAPVPETAQYTNGRISSDRLIQDALGRPLGNGRNNAGFWLAGQFRDNRFSESEALSGMLEFQSRVPATNARGEHQAYTRAEASASLRSAYSQPPRDPSYQKRTNGHPAPPVNGHAASQVNGHAQAQISAPDPEPPPLEIPLEEKIQIARDLTQSVIDSGQAMNLYGTRTAPAPYLVALAQLGEIEQRATRRILKERFKSEFVAREWDAQLQYEKSKLQIEAQKTTPYILNDDGGYKVCVANAITMMAALPIVWNSFTCRVFLTTPSPWGSEGNWTDYDDIKAAEWCQHQGLHVPPPVAMDACNVIARDRKPYYHPVVEYLKALEWDGQPRVDRWLRDYLGTIDDQYTREVGAKWMISCVKRVCEPGCQADYTLVFEGFQGKRKSTALGALTGREWFSDDIADIGSKDSAMQLQGKWIVELAELDAFRKAEITTIKAWLVRREDHFRPPYGRRAEDFPRQNVFAASTNKDNWGQDDSGLRRFWPIRCNALKPIDVEGIIAARDQLWAEAYHRYLQKEETWLNPEMEAVAAIEQHDRQDIDAWTPLIEAWLESPTCRSIKPEDAATFQSREGRVFLHEILWNCLTIPEKDWNRAHKDRVTRILRLAGYVAKRVPRSEAQGGKRPEYWVIDQYK